MGESSLSGAEGVIKCITRKVRDLKDRAKDITYFIICFKQGKIYKTSTF